METLKANRTAPETADRLEPQAVLFELLQPIPVDFSSLSFYRASLFEYMTEEEELNL